MLYVPDCHRDMLNRIDRARLAAPRGALGRKSRCGVFDRILPNVRLARMRLTAIGRKPPVAAKSAKTPDSISFHPGYSLPGVSGAINVNRQQNRIRNRAQRNIHRKKCDLAVEVVMMPIFLRSLPGELCAGVSL